MHECLIVFSVNTSCSLKACACESTNLRPLKFGSRTRGFVAFQSSVELQELEARRHGHARRRRPRAGHHPSLGLRHEDDVAADGGHPHLVPVQDQRIRGALLLLLQFE